MGSLFPNLCLKVFLNRRNLLRYIVWKEKKEFAADMKEIYHAATLEAAELALDNFEKKWNHIVLSPISPLLIILI